MLAPGLLVVTLCLLGSFACTAEAAHDAQQGSQWHQRVQAEDGRFPALAQGSAKDVPESAADLRTTSLMTLALLADGSTLRSGPYRAQTKRAVRWLRQQQAPSGRFVVRATGGELRDHAIATWAFAEAANLSQYTILHKNLPPALTVLTSHFAKQVDATSGSRVSAELVLFAKLAAIAGAEFESKMREKGKLLNWSSGARELAGAIDRLGAKYRRESPREQAAHLMLLSLGELESPPATKAFADQFAKLDLPADASDPWTLLLSTIAAYRVGQPNWKTMKELVKRRVVKTQTTGDSALKGSWDPDLRAAEAPGRVELSALNLLTTIVYYRYCALSCVTRE